MKIKLMLAILGVLLAVACSKDDDGYSGDFASTRQNTTSGSKNNAETIASDETEASPCVTFYSVDEEDTVTVSPDESQTAQAPLNITLTANVSNPKNYKYICEWRIWEADKDESQTLVTRFEENTTYLLTRSGGYNIKLYVTFSQDADTIEYESEPISVVISESKLTCPDGFTPNNDSINDTYRITAQSIIELDAKFFSRWGEKIHTATLETAKHVEGEPNKLILWDGKKNGKVVDNGIYLLHLDALGSDGRKYKIKKSITVMKDYREGTENTTGGGDS
ncbi:MAG: gliding motility-associated C-terminal domain-containing protein [Bacteroidaceae bacterium]|nr:gliding motility-associated C-terminal domain-containing protein [Bacteroidaceae bacterium]